MLIFSLIIQTYNFRFFRAQTNILSPGCRNLCNKVIFKAPLYLHAMDLADPCDDQECFDTVTPRPHTFGIDKSRRSVDTRDTGLKFIE